MIRKLIALAIIVLLVIGIIHILKKREPEIKGIVNEVEQFIETRPGISDLNP